LFGRSLRRGGKPFTFYTEDMGRGLPGWWQRNMVIYAHIMVGLARQLGSQIPDSEFVIVTNDEPGPAMAERAATPPLPYFRYGAAG
jgi:hypothetical protein